MTRMSARIRSSFTVLQWLIPVMALTMCGCFFSAKPIYYEDDRRVGLQHVEKFHRLLNEKRYDDMYGLFDSKVQGQQSKEQFTRALDGFRQNAGMFMGQTVRKADVEPRAA